MQRITLPGAQLELPRLIFGTASLFSAGDARARARLLDAAYGYGFTHFDTAPYYGFGAAERALADVLRRPDATVTTKVGLYSPGGESEPDAMIFLRKAGGRIAPSLSRPFADWSVARAKAALEASLKRLGRDRIDLYALHEPEFGAIETDEWLRFLEDAVRAGKVRAFGLAGVRERLEPFVAARSPLAPIVQCNDSLDAREADMLAAHGRALQITYGYLSAARAKDAHADPRAVLAQALKRNATGAIIVATRRMEHLDVFARAAAELAS